MKKRIGLAVVLGVLAVAASASAFKTEVVVGNLVLKAHGDFAPKALPKRKNAPVTIEGGGKLSTRTGELPPILDKFTIEFDKHGALDTKGLAVCAQRKLIATDVPAARRACKPAIVGKGFGRAVVKFPEQGPIKVGSPITLFNGPKKGRNNTIIAHAHLKEPGPATFIVPIVIEKIRKGPYGYRVKVKIPKIAGGYGHPISGSAKVGKKWTFKGRKHSYINARCETGHFVSRGEFTFKPGPEDSASQKEALNTVLKAGFVLPCKVRK
jgi:hypothetical protein